jgi:uncharacterized protein (DUF1330 family)
MKYHSAAEIEMSNQGRIRTYVQNVTRLVEQRGGRYLARTSEIVKLEGERKVPQKFPNHRMAVQRCGKRFLRM